MGVCVQTQRDESIFGSSVVGGRERGCCELYEWNKMKYKRKLYLSKTESARVRERGKNARYTCVRPRACTIPFIARFISNDLTRASSSLVVKVEKATRFKKFIPVA